VRGFEPRRVRWGILWWGEDEIVMIISLLVTGLDWDGFGAK
jgi:hypothetical protein